MITNDERRNIFLKYLAKIYTQNPNFPILEDTIYKELTSFVMKDGKQKIIPKTNLVPVQTALGREYQKNTWNHSYFLVFENRKDNKDNDFYDKMNKSIKLYISVDEKDVYQLSQMLFDFLLKENILSQAKLSQEMRNDCLVVRVETKEDAKKITKYINSLKYVDRENKKEYSPVNRPNPFLLGDDKVSVTIDGYLSYNSTISLLIKEYLQEKRNTNNMNLESITSKDFSSYVSKLLEISKKNHGIIDKYSKGEKKSFLIILNILKRNLENNLLFEELLNYQELNNTKEELIISDKYNEENKRIVRNIIGMLGQKYDSLEIVHNNILMEYFKSGNVCVFTRDYNIRNTIINNYPPIILKRITSELGFDALVEAAEETINKYNYDQLVYAIKRLINSPPGKYDIDGFTNHNNVRSILGYIVPGELLVETIRNRTEQVGKQYNEEDIASMLSKYIEEKRNIKCTNR